MQFPTGMREHSGKEVQGESGTSTLPDLAPGWSLFPSATGHVMNVMTLSVEASAVH